MKKKYLIENWSACHSGNVYTPPEYRTLRIQGWCKERSKDLGPRYTIEDYKITTSAVVEINGSEIVTRSGTIYILGTPDPAYIQWMKETGIEFDPANPVRYKN